MASDPREAVARRIWANMAGFYGVPGGWVSCPKHVRLALFKVADECIAAYTEAVTPDGK
jgi:hypothetical protein